MLNSTNEAVMYIGETWLGLGLPPNSYLQHVSVWLDVELLLFPFYCTSFQILAAVVSWVFPRLMSRRASLQDEVQWADNVTHRDHGFNVKCWWFKVMLIDVCLLQHLFVDVGHNKHEMSKDDIALKLWWGSEMYLVLRFGFCVFLTIWWWLLEFVLKVRAVSVLHMCCHLVLIWRNSDRSWCVMHTCCTFIQLIVVFIIVYFLISENLAESVEVEYLIELIFNVIYLFFF